MEIAKQKIFILGQHIRNPDPRLLWLSVPWWLLLITQLNFPFSFLFHLVTSICGHYVLSLTLHETFHNHLWPQPYHNQLTGMIISLPAILPVAEIWRFWHLNPSLNLEVPPPEFWYRETMWINFTLQFFFNSWVILHFSWQSLFFLLGTWVLSQLFFRPIWVNVATQQIDLVGPARWTLHSKFPKVPLTRFDLIEKLL